MDIEADVREAAVNDENILKSYEFIGCKHNGWYWKAKDILSTLIVKAENIITPESTHVLNQINHMFYSDTDLFVNEYK